MEQAQFSNLTVTLSRDQRVFIGEELAIILRRVRWDFGVTLMLQRAVGGLQVVVCPWGVEFETSEPRGLVTPKRFRSSTQCRLALQYPRSVRVWRHNHVEYFKGAMAIALDKNKQRIALEKTDMCGVCGAAERTVYRVLATPTKVCEECLR
jgi:hypothetical protein